MQSTAATKSWLPQHSQRRQRGMRPAPAAGPGLLGDPQRQQVPGRAPRTGSALPRWGSCAPRLLHRRSSSREPAKERPLNAPEQLTRNAAEERKLRSSGQPCAAAQETSSGSSAAARPVAGVAATAAGAQVLGLCASPSKGTLALHVQAWWLISSPNL